MSKIQSPPKILRLDEAVINRIAAGEVIQRPAAAIKEMLENSLDAESTSITVTIKGGGLQLLQIQDNGHGIRRSDLEIVCERFTTSKITTYEDLRSVSTFGFRGEALASITHVGHVTITSRTADSPCAFKARYSDGLLIPIKEGDRSEAKPCAGTIGTTITVEDLFHNIQTRKQAFKNANDEYQRILDVITKYSIHYGDKNISFTCKKHGQAIPDLHTPAQSSTLENIKLAFGLNTSRELLDFEVATEGPFNSLRLMATIKGKVSNANYSRKKSTIIFFINNRLVECSTLKKVVENVYSELLPKHSYPFVYLSIMMPPERLDVNVHPTKKEVHFLFEDELLELVHGKLNKLLKNSNESRSFLIQTSILSMNDIVAPAAVVAAQEMETQQQMLTQPDSMLLEEDGKLAEPNEVLLTEPVETVLGFEPHVQLTDGDGPDRDARQPREKRPRTLYAPAAAKKPTPNKMVRTDPQLQKISAFYRPVPKVSIAEAADGTSDCNVEQTHIVVCGLCNEATPSREEAPVCSCCDAGEFASPTVRRDSTTTRNLLSATPARLPELRNNSGRFRPVVADLLGKLRCNRNGQVEAILRSNCFVGAINSSMSLIQYETKLLMVHHEVLLRQLFYQLALRQIGEMPRIVLSTPLSICDMLVATLSASSSCADPEATSLKAFDVLREHASILEDCFSIRLDEAGCLCSLPLLLAGHEPVPDQLPEFLIRLATETCWATERDCFHSASEVLGEYYAMLPVRLEGTELLLTAEAEVFLGNHLYPAMKQYLHVQTETDIIVPIATLEQLYKVFERC